MITGAKTIVDPRLKGPVHDVRAYAAVGDGVTNDAPAIQAAIDAATAAGGGIVFVPRGSWRCGSGLVLPGTAKVILAGVGFGSRLFWPQGALGVTDFAVDTPSIAGLGTDLTHTIRDLALEGHGNAGGFEGHAMRYVRGMVCDHIKVTGFRSAQYVWGDHQTTSSSYIGQNYYGAFWPDGMPSAADMTWRETVFVGGGGGARRRRLRERNLPTDPRRRLLQVSLRVQPLRLLRRDRRRRLPGDARRLHVPRLLRRVGQPGRVLDRRQGDSRLPLSQLRDALGGRRRGPSKRCSTSGEQASSAASLTTPG